MCLQVGKRLTKVSMLSGSIVRVWGALESVLVRSESILSKSDRTMRIVRVNAGEATSLIGAMLWQSSHMHHLSPVHSAGASLMHIGQGCNAAHDSSIADLNGTTVSRSLFAFWGRALAWSHWNKKDDGDAGVRYPPQLLEDVVAVLASAQAAIPQLTAGCGLADMAPSAAGGQLGSSALQASAMGAAMAVRMEPVTPVDPKSVAKALRSSFLPYIVKGCSLQLRPCMMPQSPILSLYPDRCYAGLLSG